MIRHPITAPSILTFALLPGLMAVACGNDDDDSNGDSAACSGKPGAAGRQVVSLLSGGMEREFRLVVPESYDAQTPMALVFNIHGLTSNASQQELLAGMPAKAEAEGFITIAPEGTGTPRSWNGAGCCAPAALNNVDDVGFFRDMIEWTEADYCVDPLRIYATGMSNGGFMSNKLACDLSDRIAAIAPVVSTLGQECSPARPVPILMFNGTQDPLVEYGGTRLFPSVPASFEQWGKINGCSSATTISFQSGDTTCESYEDCKAGATTTLCTVDGGGHTWPGNRTMAGLLENVGMGKTTLAIDATDAMWDFFQVHPMPE